jgi:beta-mannosidase
MTGVDTVADIALNGAVIARTENAHREHRLSVKGLLREGPNSLRLTILPAVLEAFAKNASYPYPAPILTYQVIAPYNFLRKPASDFGWDWGPAYAPSGVYGAVDLVGYSAGVLTGAGAHQVHDGEGGVALTFDAYVRTPTLGEAGTLTVTSATGAWAAVSREVVLADAGLNTLPVALAIPAGSYALWWPVGYGAQPLYDFEVSYTPRLQAAAPAKSQAWGGAGGPAREEGEAGRPPTAQAAAADEVVVAVDDPDPASAASIPRTIQLASAQARTIPGVASFARVAARVQASAADGDTEAEDGVEVVGEAAAAPDLAEMVAAAAPVAAPAAKAPAAVSPATTTLTRRIGFRTIDLVREPLKGGVEGETFYFAVNGVPVYSKGTNMIPLHIFAAKTTAADLKAMVDATVAANMNMIRVWGGGLYPADAFYDACDEAGLLVWQEAMFACAMYPRDPAFLSEVRQEVAYQARRLNYHASMAIWGGNNEVEASLGWYDASRANRELYSNDYTALFVDTVRDALLGVSPGITYLDSSPSKGAIASGPDFYVKRWGDVGDWKRGDVHFYTTTDNALNVSTFPRAKFVSEFGFQSFPSFVVYENASNPDDWSYEAPMTVFRQRHPGDTEDMLKQMAIHYQVPPAWVPPGSKPGAQRTLFEKFIYLTQVYQAATYETASTYWRRIKTAPDAQTMGVLYWQLNDIWPVRRMEGGERRRAEKERAMRLWVAAPRAHRSLITPRPPALSPFFSGFLLVLPRLWRPLEAAALHRQTLLRARHHLRPGRPQPVRRRRGDGGRDE